VDWVVGMYKTFIRCSVFARNENRIGEQMCTLLYLHLQTSQVILYKVCFIEDLTNNRKE
jgi:hypothetical protein